MEAKLNNTLMHALVRVDMGPQLSDLAAVESARWCQVPEAGTIINVKVPVKVPGEGKSGPK